MRHHRTASLAVVVIALLLGASPPAAARFPSCIPIRAVDWITSALSSNAGAAPVRPADCARVEQNPPDFSWPHADGGTYTVSVAFPDGHTETRTATNNWLNWNGTLPAGNYAWTVTRAGVTSLPRRFTVGTDSVAFVVPDMASVIGHLLAKPRPRALPDSATLSAMAGQRDLDLQQLRFTVDGRLGEPLPPAGNRGDGDGFDRYGMRALWSLMAYVYDGTEVYREDAKRRVLNLAQWDPRGPTGVDEQESRFVAWVVTLGYDWLGPALSAAEREQALSMLNTRIGDLYDWVSGIRGWPPGDPAAHIPVPIWQSPRDSHRNVTTGMVAIMSALLVGDLPAASAWVQELLPFALNVVSPWSGEEGGYANGTAYSIWDLGAMLSTWYALRWATCGGPACIDVAQKPWVRNWGRFISYFLPPTYSPDPAVHTARRNDPGTPIGLFGDGFADPQQFEVRSPFAKGYTHFAPSPLACWYAANLAREDQIRIEYLMSPPNTCAAPADFPPALRDSLYLPAIGWVAMHSDLPDLDRTSVYFKSSPRPFGAFNHQSADQNAFVINAGGERLAIESGYHDGFNTHHWQYWIKRTRSKNAITFDGGQGQVAFEHLPDPFTTIRYGAIVQQLSTPVFDVVTGDATDAYDGALTRALRTLVFLRPGTILVYDRLASSTPRAWEWNIHALNPFEVISSDRRARITRGTQSLCVDVLAGPPRQFVPVSDSDFSSWGRSNDPTNDVSAAPLDPAAPAQYHGKFAATQASTSAEFIVLMRVNAPCGEPIVAAAAAVAPDARQAADGQCGDMEPAAARANGAWTVQLGHRRLRIAADGGVTVMPNHRRRDC
ncbi:MAG: heparinase II/III domain-containing protein [Vicinamibacterales bacterium]